jgi:hypothetical protein
MNHDAKLGMMSSVASCDYHSVMNEQEKKRSPPSHELDRFIVRFPNGMRDEIAASAQAAGRSMNAEIVMRLGNHHHLVEHLEGLQRELVEAMNRTKQFVRENELLRRTQNKESESELVIRVKDLQELVLALTERLERSDPAFAATRAHLADPKTADEIYRRRAVEAKKPQPAKTSKPRRKR